MSLVIPPTIVVYIILTIIRKRLIDCILTTKLSSCGVNPNLDFATAQIYFGVIYVTCAFPHIYSKQDIKYVIKNKNFS